MNEKLLIVDDEKGIVDVLKSYFEMQSFVVYTAYDGETALKQAACHPDLVLLGHQYARHGRTYRMREKSAATFLVPSYF